MLQPTRRGQAASAAAPAAGQLHWRKQHMVIIIIVMDNFPDILKPYVKRIKLNKLSEYKNNYNQVNCLYALKSFLDDYRLMEINELPNLIGFLLTNNYLIDYHLQTIELVLLV